MAFGFPINLELAGRRCVVIDALLVGQGKVEALLAAGATEVVVVAEGPPRRLDELARVAGVTVHRRTWLPHDLDGAFCVLGYDAEPQRRTALAAEARARGALVNVMDDISGCDFAMPALVRRGDLTLAVGTGGASPSVARRVRERLESEYGPEWSDALAIIGQVRRDTLPLLPDFQERARRWHEALDLDEAAQLVREGRGEHLREQLRERLLALRVSP